MFIQTMKVSFCGCHFHFCFGCCLFFLVQCRITYSVWWPISWYKNQNCVKSVPKSVSLFFSSLSKITLNYTTRTIMKTIRSLEQFGWILYINSSVDVRLKLHSKTCIINNNACIRYARTFHWMLAKCEANEKTDFKTDFSKHSLREINW